MASDTAVPTTAGKGVPLHPESIKILEIRQKYPRPTYDEVGPVEARKLSLQGSLALRGEYDFQGTTADLRVPSDVVKDGIPIRVYKPNNARPDPAILVYFHGGGQVVGSVEAYDVCCQMLAHRCQCIFVSVEYRLAPEHPLPAGLEDCDNAARWVIANKTAVGGTERSVVGVGGDSAGGQAASLCPHYVQGLGFQVLIYPHTDGRISFPAYQEYVDGPLLTMQLIRWFRKQYLPSPEAATDPRFSANQQPRFDHLPPAIFITAECDPLRDDSYEYEKKLKAAGVYTELVLVKGALHAFFHIPGVFRECCDKSYEAIANFIKKVVYKD